MLARRVLRLGRLALGTAARQRPSSHSAATTAAASDAKLLPVPEEEREPLAASASPQEVLDHRIRYRDLGPDPHQQEVAAQFQVEPAPAPSTIGLTQALYTQLAVYRPAKPSFFMSFMSNCPGSKR
jgi:hypothetical protein